MTEREPPSMLSLLKEAEDAPLSAEAEAERRRRVVSRIEVLRAELSTPATGDHLGLVPRHNDAKRVVPVRWLELKQWKVTAAVVLPLAAALLIWVTTTGVNPAPLVFVEMGEVQIESSTGASPLRRDETWDQADEVVLATRETEATVVLPSRTTVQLARQSRAGIHREAASGMNNDVRVGAPGEGRNESVHLRHGTVTLNVPKLAPERSFSVVTAQAKVVVRGTVFAVMIDTSPANGERTRVVVQQGEVSVWSDGREQRVSAGQEWSSRGEPTVVAKATTDTVTTPALREVASGSDAGPVQTPKVGAPTINGASDLARQNQMFESAQAARRAGQSDVALRRFTELMRVFPRSEQAHNARVEHFRLLRSLGRQAEARRSAQAYLRSHPRGFAASEARRLAQ